MPESHLRPAEASEILLRKRAEPDIADAEPPITTWPPNLRRRDASRYLRMVYGIVVQPSTLAKWHCLRSDGPAAYHAGRTPLYPPAELDAWAIRRLGPLRRSTSELRST
jgi:hypothetical protein